MFSYVGIILYSFHLWKPVVFLWVYLCNSLLSLSVLIVINIPSLFRLFASCLLIGRFPVPRIFWSMYMLMPISSSLGFHYLIGLIVLISCWISFNGCMNFPKSVGMIDNSPGVLANTYLNTTLAQLSDLGFFLHLLLSIHLTQSV